MIALAAGLRVYIACGVTDMRRGMTGLAMLVQQGQFVWPSATTTGKIALSSAQLRLCSTGVNGALRRGRADRNWLDKFCLSSNKFWLRRGGIAHHCPVQIDPENLPDDPAVLQQMLRTLLDRHADVLERVVSGRTRSHEMASLLPWNWQPMNAAALCAATPQLAA